MTNNEINILATKAYGDSEICEELIKGMERAIKKAIGYYSFKYKTIDRQEIESILYEKTWEACKKYDSNQIDFIGFVKRFWHSGICEKIEELCRMKRNFSGYVFENIDDNTIAEKLEDNENYYEQALDRVLVDEIWSYDLTEKQRVAFKEFLAGKTYEQIYKDNSQYFSYTEDVWHTIKSIGKIAKKDKLAG